MFVYIHSLQKIIDCVISKVKPEINMKGTVCLKVLEKGLREFERV